ncbi:UDP-glucose 6-dehydrogenase 1 [Acorus gramineus]|uniref:UDP-glucose 6-dehydrogenase 1 n=1 Tax=Acorus gramineus TaxID=55184 RepID=A0AAV9APZ9_ACOGR|nr:UDP-glucose 6-dehydrogenase 1 [Acorus gramineus]
MKEALGGTPAQGRKERGWRRPRLVVASPPTRYVGGPTMTMIAYKYPDIQLGTVTTSPSLNPHPITSSTPAIGVNLHFSFDVESHAVNSNIIFVSVYTPTKTHGLGAGKTADLTYT